jgi:hypothetical protein
MIMQSSPATRPTPVTMPALGASPSYISQAASGDSSKNGLPSSKMASMRSRTSSLPLDKWRSMVWDGRSPAASFCRSCSWSASFLLCSKLLLYSELFVWMWLIIWLIGFLGMGLNHE